MKLETSPGKQTNWISKIFVGEKVQKHPEKSRVYASKSDRNSRRYLKNCSWQDFLKKTAKSGGQINFPWCRNFLSCFFFVVRIEDGVLGTFFLFQTSSKFFFFSKAYLFGDLQIYFLLHNTFTDLSEHFLTNSNCRTLGDHIRTSVTKELMKNIQTFNSEQPSALVTNINMLFKPDGNENEKKGLNFNFDITLETHHFF